MAGVDNESNGGRVEGGRLEVGEKDSGRCRILMGILRIRYVDSK